ncbi:MAG: hypothetical protein AABN33_14585 [Acidobacteriota bacterium]
MSTANTNPWEPKLWHYRVHERLGETLLFFLVRVRPFDLQELTDRLKRLITEKRLGGITVFPIFGSYDLLIRAWLHPSIAAQFRAWVGSSLVHDASATKVFGGHTLYPFSADRVFKIWYEQEQFSSTLLEELDEDQILAVQSGQDPGLAQKLVDGKLIVEQNQSEGIQFFSLINLEVYSSGIEEELLVGISDYLEEASDLTNAAIYGGFGFCSILVDARVKEYASIARLPNWLGSRFKVYGLTTETYLALPQVIGDEAIGQATFLGLAGRDLLVSSIVPELYESNFSKRTAVERILRDEASKQPLTQKDKKLLHDYLIGYLEDDSTQMARTLFTFFFELEEYLRRNFADFVVHRAQGSVKELYEKGNVELSSKPLTLGDTLNLYSLAITDNGEGEESLNRDGWGELTAIRNGIVHGVDILSRWSDTLRVLIESLPKVRHLLAIIEGVTGRTYAGSY